MNWSDFIVIGLIAVFAIIGLYKGLIMSVYRFFAFIACIYASVKFSPVLAGLLAKTPVFGWIKNFIAKNLEKWSAEAFASPAAGKQPAADAEAILGTMPFPEMIKESLKGKLPSFSELTNVRGIAEVISEELARMVIMVLSVFAIYIVLKIVLSFIEVFIRNISKLPLINQVNKLGGLVFGILQGVLVVYILCAVLVLFSSIPGFAGVFRELDTSFFAGRFYQNNFIIKWLFPSAGAW
ncbi:MAG: CvpA family protein [Bacillota bacterium]